MRRPYSRTWACGLLVSLLSNHCGATTLSLSNGTSPDLTRLPAFEYRPRIFIFSDILNEVDDSESLIRYLLYSNEFNTEGICAVTSEWLPNATYPGAIKDIISEYGKVVDNLNSHVNPNAQYQDANALLSLVTSGPAVRIFGAEPRKCDSGVQIEEIIVNVQSRSTARAHWPGLQVKGPSSWFNA